VGVDPCKCAYVGDNPVRDVEGTQSAGFGMMILIEEPATLAKEPQTSEVKPDYVIHETRELLDIFPPRKSIKIEFR
jgi:FMN phosphatase YigB (HAD superfamily)